MSTSERKFSNPESGRDTKSEENISRLRRTGCAATSFFESPFDVFSNRYSLDLGRKKPETATLGRQSSSKYIAEDKKPKNSKFKIADVRKTNFDIPGSLSAKKTHSDFPGLASKIFLPTLSSSCKVTDKSLVDAGNASDNEKRSPEYGYEEFKALHSKMTNFENRPKPKISKKLSSSLDQLSTSLNTEENFQRYKQLSSSIDKDISFKVGNETKAQLKPNNKNTQPLVQSGDSMEKSVSHYTSQLTFHPKISNNSVQSTKLVSGMSEKHASGIGHEEISFQKTFEKDTNLSKQSNACCEDESTKFIYELNASMSKHKSDSVFEGKISNLVPKVTPNNNYQLQEVNEKEKGNDKQVKCTPLDFSKKYSSECTGAQRDRDKSSNLQKIIFKFESEKHDRMKPEKSKEKLDRILDKMTKLDETKESKTNQLRKKFESKADEKQIYSHNKGEKENMSVGTLEEKKVSDDVDQINFNSQILMKEKCAANYKKSDKSEISNDTFYLKQNSNIACASKDANLSENLHKISDTKCTDMDNIKKNEQSNAANDIVEEYVIENLVPDITIKDVDGKDNKIFDLMTFDDTPDFSEDDRKSLSSKYERKISRTEFFSGYEKCQENILSFDKHRKSSVKEHGDTLLGRIVTFKDSEKLGSGTFKDITNCASDSNCTQATETSLDFEDHRTSFSDTTEVKSFSVDCKAKSATFSQSNQADISPVFKKISGKPTFNIDDKMSVFEGKTSSFGDRNISFDVDVHWDSSVNDTKETFKEKFMQRTETGFRQQNYTSGNIETRTKFEKEMDKENRGYSEMSSQSSAFHTEKLQRSIILNQRSSTTYTKKLRIGQRTIRRTSRFTRYVHLIIY